VTGRCCGPAARLGSHAVCRIGEVLPGTSPTHDALTSEAVVSTDLAQYAGIHAYSRRKPGRRLPALFGRLNTTIALRRLGLTLNLSSLFRASLDQGRDCMAVCRGAAFWHKQS
jgi:hypothetical protein